MEERVKYMGFVSSFSEFNQGNLTETVIKLAERANPRFSCMSLDLLNGNICIGPNSEYCRQKIKSC